MKLAKEGKSVMAVFEEVDLFLTVVLTAEMMLKTTDGNENEKFFDAGYRFFLRRTGQGLQGWEFLAILSGVMAMTQTFVGLVFNNVVDDSIEKMVEDRIGLYSCMSPLTKRVPNTIFIL